MKEIRVSIIIPVYNAETTLKACFESCLNQNYAHLEIIAINDYSNDNSGAICDQYTRENANFQVIHNKVNLGPQQSRPRGIEKAKGNFLFFLDADDYIPSVDVISLLCEQQRKTNADVIIGGYLLIDGLKKQPIIPPLINTTAIIDKLVYFFEHPFRTLWAKLYRTSVFKDLIIPDDIHHGEDLILNTQILAETSLRIVAFEEVIYGHRRTSTSITNNLSFQNALNVLKAEWWIYAYLLDKGLMAEKRLSEALSVHAIPKIIAAIKQRGNAKFGRNYFRRLYQTFYKPCPKEALRQFPIHNRILVPLEHLSPSLSSIYATLLEILTKK